MKKTVFALAVALCGCLAIPASAQETKETEQPVLDMTNPFKNRLEKKVSTAENDANSRIVSLVKPENMLVEKRKDYRLCGNTCATQACEVPAECRGSENVCVRDRRPGHCNARTCVSCNPFDGIQLTEAQKAKLDKARDAKKKKCAKIREKMAKERAKADESYMKELQKILTPEQMAKYKANRHNVGKRGNKHGRRGHVAPGEVIECPAPMVNYGKCGKTE